jgi:hypothetical protein
VHLFYFNNNTLYLSHNNNFTSYNVADPFNIETTKYSHYLFPTLYGSEVKDLLIVKNYAFILTSYSIETYKINSSGIISEYFSRDTIFFGNEYIDTENSECTGFYIKNDKLYLLKSTISIEKEIFAIFDLSNLTSITIIWSMEVTNPLLYSKLVLFISSYFSILYVIFTTVFLIYRDKKNANQKEVATQNEDQEIPNILEKNKLESRITHGNRLLFSGFLILFLENLAVPFITIPIFGDLLFDGRTEFLYALNFPLFLDIIAITLIIVGFGLKIKEDKKHNNILVMIIWIMWIASALLYRIFWDLPSYSSLQGMFFSDSPTYRDYLIQLPFLVSTILFSFAIIITVVFTDLGNKSRMGLIVYSIMNVSFSVLFYFSNYTLVTNAIFSNYHYYFGGYISLAFLGLAKVILIPSIGMIVFILAGSYYKQRLVFESN